ncbi:hypothetical protein GGI17_001962 [Coemansia sp. S146]|nr:hypothetical protein GGI17_001962 [Coemansia sp. S146]
MFDMATPINNYSHITGGFVLREIAMTSPLTAQSVGAGESGGASEALAGVIIAPINEPPSNSATKADAPLADIKSTVVHASSANSATKTDTLPADVNSTWFFVSSMRAKRRCSDVDAVYKKRTICPGDDGVGSAVNVVYAPPPLRAWGSIRARPWPKGRALTLAARHARRRSPHLPGSSIRLARRFSPGDRAILRAMRFSSAHRIIPSSGANSLQQVQRTFNAGVAVPAQHTITFAGAVVSVYPADQGASEGGIAPAPAQQQIQSIFGIYSTVSTQLPVITNGKTDSDDDSGADSELPVEHDVNIAHAPARPDAGVDDLVFMFQQLGLREVPPAIHNAPFLARPNDGSHSSDDDDGDDDYLGDQLNAGHWVMVRRHHRLGPPETAYASTAESMFRALVNATIMNAGDRDIGLTLRSFTEMSDADIVDLHRGAYAANEVAYIAFPGELAANDGYKPVAPYYGQAPDAADEEYDPDAPGY